MLTVKTNNELVITNDEMSSIVELTYPTFLIGATNVQEESLFEFGFLYDKKTQLVITTRKRLTWPHMKSRLKFRVFKLDLQEIDATFEKRSKIIMKNNKNVTKQAWLTYKVGHKLFILEQDNSFLSCKTRFEEFNATDLCIYLEKYVDSNYENLK